MDEDGDETGDPRGGPWLDEKDGMATDRFHGRNGDTLP